MIVFNGPSTAFDPLTRCWWPSGDTGVVAMTISIGGGFMGRSCSYVADSHKKGSSCTNTIYMQRGEEREEAKVQAREVLTAVEHHVANLKAHGFDPQVLCEERYGETESSSSYLSLRVSALCRALRLQKASRSCC